MQSFYFTSLTAGHKMSPMCALEDSSYRITLVYAKYSVVVMSQILLVGPASYSQILPRT